VNPRDDPQDELVGYEVADRFGDDDSVRVHGVARLGEAPSPFGGERHPDPCTLVIFGVTGDLAHRKLMPALYDLGCHGVLPFGTTIVGYGRQELSDDGFRALLQSSIDDHYGAETVDGSLCERILLTPRYVQGQFDDPGGYERLAAQVRHLGVPRRPQSAPESLTDQQLAPFRLTDSASACSGNHEYLK